ncbi:transcription termination factor 2 isoform X1 [Phyllopteryx taeniolatus]|uniref:transcription termination factor 2 isoform X1 n=3 Tax=Phyllopteryx taeniolatus TaxID=161469 RepID=UPI002AD3F2F0|nr:transcription termination factor 2 isoform X1 [Phyllopteryx taeniolatus]
MKTRIWEISFPGSTRGYLRSVMDKVTCDVHGGACMLKTGVKDGPTKGRSFYVCVDKRGCDFSKAASISPSHCLQHEDSMVELQALTSNQQQQCNRLYYRCIVGKKAGQRWCGNVPWTVPEKEEKKCEKRAQASCLPPVRNPFKALEKADQESECRKMQGESQGKDNREKKPTGEEEKDDEGEGQTLIADTYRGKHLPAGITLKKKSVDKTPPPSTFVPKSDMATSAVSLSVPKSDKATSEGSVETASVSHSTPKNGIATSGVPMPVPKNAMATIEVSVSEPKSDPTTSSLSMFVPKCEMVTCKGPIVTSPTESNMAASKGSVPMANASTSVAKSEMVASRGSARASPSTSAPKSEMVASRVSDNNKQWRTRQTKQYHDDDEDVVLVSVKPPQKTPKAPTTAIQKPLTAYPGFQPASNVKGPLRDPQGMHTMLSIQLQQEKATLSVVNLEALPDKGERLRTRVRELEAALESLNLAPTDETPPTSQVVNPFSRPGGTILIPAPPAPGPHLQHSQGFSQMYGEHQAFYGGRMTDNRLLAVKNATYEAIDHLHTSLESCPAADTEALDPKGLKVSLLAHQKRALAWLLWREAQNPCGGILADDMGLGKTLTMIALILAQKINAKVKAKEEGQKKKEEEKEEELKKQEGWLSRTDCRSVISKATLVICPASLLHHWKKEIERHVKVARLSVYLYHGPDRIKNPRVLADHDVVVTTYSLVSREAPGHKEADKPNKEANDAPAAAGGGPLLCVAWARVILDEAHNIKNPKVQQSMAVCQLRASARWAMTGTPIQNNLLDMYSLLNFLRCSPFDEYKVWKAQVDNGSKRGRERLNILTRTLMLRRTKDQQDSSGKPLVALPDRTCKMHQLQLSEDEQAVYDVVFAQSRATLQNYLKKHEGNDVKRGSNSASNTFDRFSQEFGLSQSDPPVSSWQQPQQAPSTAHILSLLLRLRQCCCHLSLLQKTLDSSELQGDAVVLSLEEQLNALSLTSGPSTLDAAEDTVGLNGMRFPLRLFEDGSRSTKISAIVSELEAIRAKGDDQKSVIVSQWTSLLHIVALHLRQMGLRYGIIDGTVNPKRRMDLVEEFNTNPKEPQVMLVSLCAGGVGLNLVGGNHLFLMDMHWNPALEDQACDRIYRVGQRRDVTIHRFECEGTVEQKISRLQAKKKQLAQSVLSGTESAIAKLSLTDLKIIFGV